MASKVQVAYHAAMTLWFLVFAIFIMIAAIWLLTCRWDILFNQCGFGVQYISLWAIVLQTYYFSMRLKEDLTVDSEENRKLSAELSELFTYVVLPLSVNVSVVFWVIFSIDTRLVDRFDILVDLGSTTNHATHSATAIFVFIETLLGDKPKKPISLTAVFWINFSLLMFYSLLLEGLFTLSGLYPYNFLSYLTDSDKPVACTVVSLLGVATVSGAYATKEYLPGYVRAHFKGNS